MSAPTIADVIRHLTQLRASIAHALKAEGLSVARFNDATKHLRELDQQLTQLGVPPMGEVDGKVVTLASMTRNQRRIAKRSQGNGLEQRLQFKAQRKRIVAMHGDATDGPV